MTGGESPKFFYRLALPDFQSWAWGPRPFAESRARGEGEGDAAPQDLGRLGERRGPLVPKRNGWSGEVWTKGRPRKLGSDPRPACGPEGTLVLCINPPGCPRCWLFVRDLWCRRDKSIPRRELVIMEGWAHGSYLSASGEETTLSSFESLCVEHRCGYGRPPTLILLVVCTLGHPLGCWVDLLRTRRMEPSRPGPRAPHSSRHTRTSP